MSNPETDNKTSLNHWICLGILGMVVLWAYWTTLGEMASKWSSDPQYSHGYLVPVFAIAYLWLRRGIISGSALSPSWWGLPVLLIASALRLAGAYFFYGWFDHISLLPILAGAALAIGGWRALRWSWISIAYLAFMVPLPYRVERALAQPLQRIATTASTYVLQTCGVPALAEGNVIVIDDIRMNVADACSGLRMLIVFFALSFATVILIERPFWEKIVVLLAAWPIAIVSNVTRIVCTGAAYALGWDRVAHFIHDHAEWLMMPLALALLWLVLSILARLFVLPEEERPLKVGLSATRVHKAKVSVPAQAQSSNL